MTETRRFLDFLWPNYQQGYLVLWRAKDRRSEYFRLDQKDEISARVQETGWRDSYFGTGVRREDLGPKKSGTEADVCAWSSIWVDADVLSVVHANQQLPPDFSIVAKALEDVLDPSGVVDSGYGLHAYYALDKPFDGEPREFKRVLVAAQARVRERLGYHLDNTAKLQQILRLPGTLNCKIPSDPRPVHIVYEGPRYSWKTLVEKFTRRRGRPEGSRQVTPSAPGRGPGRPPAAVKLAAAAPAGAPDWTVEVRQRAANLVKDDSRQLAHKLLLGEPFAEEGSRNETCNKLVGVMVYLTHHVRPEATAEEIFEAFFRPSIEKMAAAENDPANPALDEEQVVNQIERAIHNARADAEKKAEIEARIAEGIRASRAVRPRGREAVSDPPAKTEVVDPGTDEDERRRSIIQIDDSFYIWVGDRYQPSIRKDALEVKLRDDFPPQVFWREDPETGLPKRKKLQELLLEYCTAARHHTYDLSIEKSFYAPDEDMYYEAATPVRNLEPRFDPVIDEWLRILGGNEWQSLFDWISTVTWLNRQTSALFLSGASGAGKTLLATGLSRLWTKNGPTELKQIAGNFNADLLRCPLVLADEKVDPRVAMRDISQQIGTTTRTVSRKFRSGATLKGSIRYIFLGNDENVLSLGDEGVGMHELDAVVGRILFVEVPPAAVAYLKSIGGITAGTAGWVDDDLIARHALWMEKNLRADFNPSTRWLVPGQQTAMHTALVTQGKMQEIVLEWLAKFLTKPLPTIVNSGGIKWDEGRLLVHTAAVTDAWDSFMAPPTPTGAKVGRSLRMFSKGKHGKYWVVQHELIFQFAEKNQIGDVDEMRKNLEKLGVKLKSVPLAAPITPEVVQ